MNKKVITPVGTSLFTNYMKKSDIINTDYDIIEDKAASKWTDYSIYIERIRGKVKIWAENKLKKTPQEINASAEITSLVKILEEVNDDLEVYLLATETVVSRLAAEILQAVLPSIERNGHKITVIFNPVHANDQEKDVIEGLQVTDDERFQDVGLTSLFSRIKKISNDFKDEAILNITGGFKAVIPYLTIIGQLYEIPQCYIFEDTKTDGLLHIPQLPIQFDLGFAEQYYPYLSGDLDFTDDIRNVFQRLHLFPKNQENKLTVVGEMFQEVFVRESPVDKHVLGYFVEYKLFEYYIKYPYSSYTLVERQLRNIIPEELDIVLKKFDDPHKRFIVIEAKPFSAFVLRNRFKKTKGQLENHVNSFKELSKIPEEYHLYIYRFPNHPQQAIVQRLLTIGNLFHALPSCKFRIFFLSIDLTCDDPTKRDGYYKNRYQKFMEEPLEPCMFEEYNLCNKEV